MQIDIQNITDKKNFEISGDESWLEPTYSYFENREKRHSPKIKSSVSITPYDFGVFYVEGHVDFSPELRCTRCNSLTNHSISRDFSMSFNPVTKEDLPNSEGDLHLSNLDEYTYESQIDLEEILNEQIQCSIPTTIHCKDCKDQANEPLVHGKGNSASDSPFSILKDLNFPKN